MGRIVAGVDVYYTKEKAYTGLVLMNSEDKKVVGEFTDISDIPYPYVPTRFALREGPLILKVLKKTDTPIDLLICNGHGRLHPKGSGLAVVVGKLAKVPTIGVAKEILCGEFSPPPPQKGSFSLVFYNGVKGMAIRARENGRIIFLSEGYGIDLEEGYKILVQFLKFSLPEPLRLAHILAKKQGKEVK